MKVNAFVQVLSVASILIWRFVAQVGSRVNLDMKTELTLDFPAVYKKRSTLQRVE